MMRKRCGWGKVGGIVLGVALPLLCGCGVLPELPLGECRDARVEILLDAASEEGVAVVWDPEVVAVDSTEVRVDEDETGRGRRVVVTVELGR